MFEFWNGASQQEKIGLINNEVSRVLKESAWTQLPDSGLTIQEQLEQQELRAAWRQLLETTDPDAVIFPQYPLMQVIP